MNPDPNDELADKLLAGEELEAFRQTSLERGLALMKAHRQRRRQGQITAVVVLLAAFLTVVMRQQHPAAEAPHEMAASQHHKPVPVSKVHLINDDRLVSLFPNRPLAIIGPPGREKLIFLDGAGPVTQ